MKKILALMLSLLMVFSGVVGIFADEEVLDETAETAEEEVVEAGPYDLALEVLAKLNILKGNEDGDYMAEADVQRYQAALFMARIMTGDTEDANWVRNAANATTFEDVDGTDYAQYNAAFGYCFQKGVINGRSETIYDPAGQITFQEFLKMAVCALGYVTEGTAEPYVAIDPTLPDWTDPDANNSIRTTRLYSTYSYPYETNEKAIALGLTKGITGVGFEDYLTRGEVAQIIYNTLVAINQTGTTYINDVFGVTEETVVITGTWMNVYGPTDAKPARDEYVAFKFLGKDGDTKGSTYYLPYTAFGLAEDTAAETRNSEKVFDNVGYENDIAAAHLVGHSFTVASNDDFASLLYCFMNTTESYWNLGTVTTPTYPIAKSGPTYNGVAYTIVSKYSYLPTAQGTVNGSVKYPGQNEIITYIPFGGSYTGETVYSFYYNTNGDIVDKTGKVLLTYLAFTGKYFKEILDDDDKVVAYQEATDADFNDASINKQSATTVGFKKIGENIISGRAYANVEVIDDDGDDIFDRAIYNEYTVAKLTNWKNGDDDNKMYIKAEAFTNTFGKETIFNMRAENLFWTFDNAEEDITLDVNGGYYLISWNKQSNVVDVLMELEVKVGVLTHFSVSDKKIWIQNTPYPANYADLAGAALRDYDDKYKVAISDYLLGLYQKSVQYIVLDGQIIYVGLDAVASGGIVVIEDVIGITMDMSIETYAYVSGKIGLQRIFIKTIDSMLLGINANGFTSLISSLTYGTILPIVSVDSTGYYNLRSLRDGDKWTTNTLKFTTYGLGYFAKEFSWGGNTYNRFTASADNYYVFVPKYLVDLDGNKLMAEIKTFKGIPQATEASIVDCDFYWGGGWFCVLVDNRAADDGVTGFDSTSTTDFVFYDSAKSYANYATDYVTLGANELQYYNLFSLKAGAWTANVTVNQLLSASNYNFRLSDKTWWRVVDGKVVSSATVEEIINFSQSDAWKVNMLKTAVVTFYGENGEKATDASKKATLNNIIAAMTASDPSMVPATTLIGGIGDNVNTISNSKVAEDTLGTFKSGTVYQALVVYDNLTGKTIVYAFSDESIEDVYSYTLPTYTLDAGNTSTAATPTFDATALTLTIKSDALVGSPTGFSITSTGKLLDTQTGTVTDVANPVTVKSYKYTAPNEMVITLDKPAAVYGIEITGVAITFTTTETVTLYKAGTSVSNIWGTWYIVDGTKYIAIDSSYVTDPSSWTWTSTLKTDYTQTTTTVTTYTLVMNAANGNKLSYTVK